MQVLYEIDLQSCLLQEYTCNCWLSCDIDVMLISFKLLVAVQVSSPLTRTLSLYYQD